MPTLLDQGLISHDPTRGTYMPWITPLPDGTWLATQHVGQGLGTPDNYIETLRSTDQGQTWHNQGPLHGQPPDDGWSYRGPQISCIPDGRLILTATRFRNEGDALFNPDTEALQRPEMLLFWSTDQGHSWSPPQPVPVDLPPERYTCNGAGQLLQLAPDRWMYPFETWKPDSWDGPPDQKAAALFSSDQGRSWDESALVADDPTGALLWWDQMNALLPDGRVYTLLWTHRYGTSKDLPNHWTLSTDGGRTWSPPRPTNLHGQVCTPIPLPDGRVAAVYNDRHDPQGIRLAISDDLETFDTAHQITVFDAGAEATLGTPQSDNFLAEHMLIAFGKPGGRLLPNGDILVWFWCTTNNITHTRWVRLRH